MKWQKLGHLFSCQNLHPKLLSHASNPLAVQLGGSVYRIYYGGRDQHSRTSVGYVDVDIDRRKVLAVRREPVFEFGPIGSFYSHGVSIGCAYTAAGRTYLLFMGWHIPAGRHWRGEIGRLHIEGDGSLTLDPEKPLIGLAPGDPISLSYPFVTAAPDGVFRMWYGSTITWDAGNGEMVHVIKQAKSEDGAFWTPTGECVPYVINLAQAFSRPTIAMNQDGTHEMWFSYRGGTGTTYRIGYAKSADGDNWELDLGSSGIDVSHSGWDSEMIEYPFVFLHRGRQYMLYNGNGYGKSGFGLAVRED